MEVKTQNCPCPKKECENNTNCETCRIKHKTAGNLPYCQRPRPLNFDSNGVNISYFKSGNGRPRLPEAKMFVCKGIFAPPTIDAVPPKAESGAIGGASRGLPCGSKSIIFVHGNMGSGAFFKDCHKLFGGYTVYTPDSRSHGKSDKVKRLNYDDMADDIVRLIEHEKMVKPILFGFSDGGIIGLKIAMKHPDLLSKLFVAGVNLTPKGINGFWRFCMRTTFCLTFPFSLGDKMRLMISGPYIKADDLKAITIPTVLFCGEKDIVKLADSQTVVDNAKDAQLVIIPGENHGSYIENNEKLCNALKPFLEEEVSDES